MPVLLANYQANIADQAIKCRMFLENSKKSSINYYLNSSKLVNEEPTMSSTSSTTGTKFKLTKEAANETTSTTVPFYQQEQQQMQMLLLQHQHQQYMLQQFAYAERNNISQLYPLHPPTTITAAAPAQNVTGTGTTQFFHGKSVQQLISTITPQQQQHIQQAYKNFYGSMLPQHLDYSPRTCTVNTLPILTSEDVALTTPITDTKADKKPDIEALNDLTARIQQSSSLSLVELNTQSPQLTATAIAITTTQTRPTNAESSTLSLTAAKVSPILLAAKKTTKNKIFNMSLDPEYQLQSHQQQKEQEPTKQDHEKQTLLLPHNETAHAIDSSKLPAATTALTKTASSTCEVASIVLTVEPPPVDTETLAANCKGG